MLTVAISKRNKLQNIIVLTPKDGKTKARELLNNPKNRFTVRIGNRLYANKKLLDEWLEYQCKRA